MRRISTGQVGDTILGTLVTEDNTVRPLATTDSLSLTGNTVEVDVAFEITGDNSLRVYNGSNYVNVNAPGLSSNVNFTLPNNTGSTGDVLRSDGAGNLSFQDVAFDVNNQTADSATYYPLMSTSSSGEITGVTTTTGKLEFQPSSGTLSATKIVSTFEGDLTGNVTGTADSASSLIESNDYRVDSLGVGTDASSNTGEIRATNNITSFYSSDIALKENVEDISNSLEIVNNIRGKVFSWRDEYIQQRGGEDGYFVQKRDFGVIAQDVQNSFPLAVREKQDNTLAVDYTKLAAVAFAAISELDTKVEKLKEMFDASDNR